MNIFDRKRRKLRVLKMTMNSIPILLINSVRRFPWLKSKRYCIQMGYKRYIKYCQMLPLSERLLKTVRYLNIPVKMGGKAYQIKLVLED